MAGAKASRSLADAYVVAVGKCRAQVSVYQTHPQLPIPSIPDPVVAFLGRT